MRVVEKPENIFGMLLVNKEEHYTLNIAIDKKGKVSGLGYGNDDGYYSIDLKEDSRNVTVYSETVSEEYCNVNYEGKTNKEYDKCSSKKIKAADKIKKAYEQVFDDCGLDEEELINVISWFNEEKEPIIKKEVTKLFESRKALSNDEIIDVFKENDFNLTIDTDGTINFKYVSDLTSTEHKTISFLKTSAGQPYGIAFINGLYYEEWNGNEGMIYCYYINDDVSTIMSRDGQKFYDLTNKKSMGDVECDEKFIKRAGTLEFVFEDTLEKMHLTKKDLVNFFKTYK